LWAGQTTVRHFLAEAACATRVNATMIRNPLPSAGSIKRAISLDPANGAYHAKLAQKKMNGLMSLKNNKGQENAEHWENQQKICLLWQKALLSDPANAQYWYQYGMFATWQENQPRHKQLYLADQAMDTAFELQPYGPWILYRLGGYWLWRSKTSAQPAKAHEKGLGLLKKAVLIDRSFLNRSAELLWYHDPRPETVFKLVAKGDPGIKKAVQRWLKIKNKGESK
jgi:hypothetical protein